MRSPIAIAALLAVGGPSAADTPPRHVPQYSVWTGSYDCAQGVTSLRLVIETRSTGGAAMGKFEFGPHDANPNLPTGSFWMKGTVQLAASGVLEIRLAPDRWIQQPAGWVMVPLRVTSNPEQRAITGSIEFPSCSWIKASRDG